MPADRKYDLNKDRADYRARSGRFDVLTVPPTRYLMVDGHGDPNTDPSYAAALAALYPVAYALKFASKAGRTGQARRRPRRRPRRGALCPDPAHRAL